MYEYRIKWAFESDISSPRVRPTRNVGVAWAGICSVSYCCSPLCNSCSQLFGAVSNHKIQLKLWIFNFNTDHSILKVNVQTFTKLYSFWHNSIKKGRVMPTIMHCATFQYSGLFREELSVWFSSLWRLLFTSRSSRENVVCFSLWPEHYFARNSFVYSRVCLRK